MSKVLVTIDKRQTVDTLPINTNKPNKPNHQIIMIIIKEINYT